MHSYPGPRGVLALGRACPGRASSHHLPCRTALPATAFVGGGAGSSTLYDRRDAEQSFAVENACQFHGGLVKNCRICIRKPRCHRFLKSPCELPPDHQSSARTSAIDASNRHRCRLVVSIIRREARLPATRVTSPHRGDGQPLARLDGQGTLAAPGHGGCVANRGASTRRTSGRCCWLVRRRRIPEARSSRKRHPHNPGLRDPRRPPWARLGSTGGQGAAPEPSEQR
jgi:hypothetical protein